MWVFDPTTYRHTMDDIKYGNNIIRAVEPLGGIGFVFYCLEGEDPTMNFREVGKIMPPVFMEKWREDCIPNQADKLEHSPELLRILMKNFLPNDWALVADGISTAILTIITSEFCGSEVIVLEDSETRSTFLYNELGHLVIPPQGPTMVPSGIG
jgi:hypothetical protein